jgi:hypothetical protein
MIDWIRMATGMKHDRRVHEMADACCKGDEAKMAGHLQFMLSEFPEHARDGDIHAVTDTLLERWAVWRGKAGAFAKAVRTTLCDDRGVVRAWEKHNGAAIRKSDRDAARQAAYRARRSRDDTPDVPPPVTRDRVRDVTPDVERNVTHDVDRDVTLRDVTTPSTTDVVVSPPSGDTASTATAGCAEQFVEPSHRTAYLAIRRAHRSPESLDATLTGMSQGLGAPGGKVLTWHQLGTALLEMQTAQAPITANVLRGFAAKAPAQRPAIRLVDDWPAPDAPAVPRRAS